MPYPNFQESAKCLDRQRLGKQRIEAFSLVSGMDDPENFGWRYHPAFKMWLGYQTALIHYGIAICIEWIERGYKDNLINRFYDYLPDFPSLNYNKPFWLGNENFHSSHRSVLLYKNYEWYSQFGWTEKPDVPVNNRYGYLWPV